MRFLAASLVVLVAVRSASAGELTAAEKIVARVSDAVLPAVVRVWVAQHRGSAQTGVVIGQGGVILTTRRSLIVGGIVPKTVNVWVPEKKSSLQAEVIATDRETDTAILRAKGLKVKPVPIGRSADVHQGMWVLLVGLGVDSVAAARLGVVANIVRDANGPRRFVASSLLGRGARGAPLIDLSGDLIGIVSGKSEVTGYSVVLPFDRVRDAYRNHESAVRKLLGRPPPPRAWRTHVADAIGPVIEEAVRRASSSVVGVRSGSRLDGEKEAAVVYPKEIPEKDKKRYEEIRKRITPRLVPGKLHGHDRSSGTVVHPAGWILAPLRVTGWPGPRRKLTVDFQDGAQLAAKVVGTDERLRIALLKVELSGLAVLQAAPRAPVPGTFAVALGFPHGAPGEASAESTFGVVSRTGALAELHPALDAVQTDAAVSGANRGGPLVDIEGRLLGYLMDVNDTDQRGYFGRVRARYGENAGLGFAIPPRVIEEILPKLMAGSHFASAFLGISGVPTKRGLLIQSVTKSNSDGEPTTAKTAGLKVGDILVSLGGAPTRSIAELRKALAPHAAGDLVDFVYLRDGKESRVKAKLSAR